MFTLTSSILNVPLVALLLTVAKGAFTVSVFPSKSPCKLITIASVLGKLIVESPNAETLSINTSSAFAAVAALINSSKSV